MECVPRCHTCSFMSMTVAEDLMTHVLSLFASSLYQGLNSACQDGVFP